MIDPKESRIGNLVQDAKENIVEVDAPLFVADQNPDGFFDLSDCYPIPITPEWLERLGFLPYPFNGGWRHESCWLEIDNMGDYFQYQHGYAEIKYVHQLQNLYHALTGQELEVKELVK